MKLSLLLINLLVSSLKHFLHSNELYFACERLYVNVSNGKKTKLISVSKLIIALRKLVGKFKLSFQSIIIQKRNERFWKRYGLTNVCSNVTKWHLSYYVRVDFNNNLLQIVVVTVLVVRIIPLSWSKTLILLLFIISTTIALWF